jgi:hypothetical protein
MSTIRLCVCPCGRVSIQEPAEDPSCHKCGDRYANDIDWFNFDAGELKEDFEYALNTINDYFDKTDVEQPKEEEQKADETKP